MAFTPNPHLAKRHISYAIDEVARLYGVHRNTVRAWIKRGLPTIDQNRPLLVHGADLADFLRRERGARRQACSPGQMYCLRCRVPRMPMGGQAIYTPLSPTQGNLGAVCEVCGARMFRRISLAKLPDWAHVEGLRVEQAG